MKKYGIKISLPTGDTMTAAHLLGADWTSYRWFDDAGQRDAALREMQRQPPYYRNGDSPTVILEQVEQDS